MVPFSRTLSIQPCSSHTPGLGEGSRSQIAGSLSSSHPDFNTVHQAKHAG